MRKMIFTTLLACAAVTAFGEIQSAPISGNYLEVRSCDVYTGPCFANAEMGLAGKEGMMFWSIREGDWNGVSLAGLGVVAVVKTDGTLGNLKYEPRSGPAVLIVDDSATAAQKTALADFAQAMAGSLISEVVDVKSAAVEATFGGCSKAGCASLKAGSLVQVSTSCLDGKHDVCGNEETFYPPLTKLDESHPVYTDLATFTGQGLDVTWQIAGTRSAFLGTFSAKSEKAPAQLALQ